MQQDQQCAALSIEACKANADCRVSGGASIELDRQCIGARAELGCEAADKPCDDAMTVAKDAQGRAWLFGNSCIPAGLEYLSPSTGSPQTEWVGWPQCTPPAPPVASRCADLHPDECKRSDCVALQATAFDPELPCVRGAKNVMCMDRSQGCTAAIAYARDPHGQAWQLTSGCQPEGWTAFSPDSAGAPQPSWPGCNP